MPKLVRPVRNYVAIWAQSAVCLLIECHVATSAVLIKKGFQRGKYKGRSVLGGVDESAEDAPHAASLQQSSPIPTPKGAAFSRGSGTTYYHYYYDDFGSVLYYAAPSPF